MLGRKEGSLELAGQPYLSLGREGIFGIAVRSSRLERMKQAPSLKAFN